ncbi:NKRF factor, partial [Amia calva]|nr:NKRF factor [Amia calva]
MVWVNHVFMGCRYGPELMQKVLKMAEGIDIGEMPSFELVPGAESKKRPSSSDDKEEPVKKLPMAKFVPRPRFEPVHFVSSSGTEEKENEKERRRGEMNSLGQRDSSSTSFHSSRSHASAAASAASSFRNATPYVFDSWAEEENREVPPSTSGLGFGNRSSSSNYMSKMQQDYSAKFEAHYSKRSETSQAYRFDSEGTTSRDVRRGLGFGNQDRHSSSGGYSRGHTPSMDNSHPSQIAASQPAPISAATLEEKQRLISRVSHAMAITYRDPTSMSGPDTPNYNFILSRSIQACKTNPEYIYVNLKEIPPGDLPKNRKVPSDGYACELRCQCIYLATGYSGSKNGARDRASEQAVKLFLKPVEVRVIRRKYRHAYVNDLVVCQSQFPTPCFAPALRNPEDKPPPSSKGQYEPDSRKHWTEKKHLSELVILENSDNAICIINDTAQFNKVSADYKFMVLPDHRWKCEVYLEGQFVAAGIGPKKTVKHIAAEEALAKLRQTQAVVKSNLRKDGNEDAISRNQILGRSAEEAFRQEIKEDNIGNQLLRKMGWKGGGLGREGEGIAEPIKVKEQFTREGLGLDMERSGNQLNKRDIEEIIRNYASSDRQDDLRFSTELNNDERKQIHQMAQKYGLRSKSYGQGMQRFLIVSRKVQKEQLIGQLLQEGQVGRYELVKPQASH